MALSDGSIRAPRPGPAGGPPGVMFVPLTCLAVRMPDGGPVVLIDGGFGPNPETLGNAMPSAGRLLDSLAGAGLSVDDIDVVLLSHFDIDHVAGLYDASGAQVFRRATYYASAEAVEFWSRKDIDLSASPTLPWVKKERLVVSAHVLQCAQEKLKTFHAGDEILPGIESMALPGHAPGQAGFVLTSEGETLVYTADAITHPVGSLETPEVHNIMDLDPHTAVATRRHLVASLADAGWRSFSPHFPFPGWGRVRKQNDKHVWKAGE